MSTRSPEVLARELDVVHQELTTLSKAHKLVLESLADLGFATLVLARVRARSKHNMTDGRRLAIYGLEGVRDKALDRQERMRQAMACRLDEHRRREATR